VISLNILIASSGLLEVGSIQNLDEAGEFAHYLEEKMKRLILMSLVLGIGVLSVAPAMAGGLYVGAGIGNTFFSSDPEDAADEIGKIDENSTSWKIFGGFSGTKFFGLEGGYRHFGNIDTNVGDTKYEFGTKGIDIEAVGRFTIAIVDIFGKAGVMFWGTDFKIDGTKIDFDDDSGTDFMWGLGAGVHLGPIGVRLEWESLEVSGPDNLSMVSLSATFGF